MRIVLGADSAGKPLLDVIAAHLAKQPQHEVEDLSQSGFYADTAAVVAHAIQEGRYDHVVLQVCNEMAAHCRSNEAGASSHYYPHPQLLMTKFKGRRRILETGLPPVLVREDDVGMCDPPVNC